MTDHNNTEVCSIPEYTVFDLETTIKDGTPSAFHHGNFVVLSGMLHQSGRSFLLRGGVPPFTTLQTGLLVGHNICFDLRYLYQTYEVAYLLRAGLTIWDTQIAEYVLSGQQTKMSSLNELALKYGGTIKDSLVSDAFERGEGADTIDPDVLAEYLTGDLKNTELVFLAQYEQADREGLVPLIKWMCHARLCTSVMQHYGMTVNVTALTAFKESLQEHRRNLSDEIKSTMMGEIKAILDCKYSPGTWQLNPAFDPTTDSWVSSYLFGGEAMTNVHLDTGETFKSGLRKGMPKPKSQWVAIKFTAKIPTCRPFKSTANFSVVHPMDDTVIEELKDKHVIVRQLSDLRRLDKLIGTYCDGILKNTWPDGRVHPEYNHALTATGRLSCSKPNLQNQDVESKPFFIPERKGDVFVEFDFKQLEVCALAHLSQDKQLIFDITNGVDLHYETGKEVFGWISPADMTEELRRAVKGVNFGLIYGGTATGLSNTTGLSKDLVQRLINAFYSRYPEVKLWQNRNISAVRDGRVYDGGVYTKLGYPAGHSALVPVSTGRMYVFHEYDAPDWMRAEGELTSFSPTEIKNYPVQGFATGDIVPIALGVLIQAWARGYHDRYCKPRLTVHDSFMFTCHKDKVDSLIEMVNNEVVPGVMFVLEETFGIKLAVPLKLDVKVGPNWGEMKKYPAKKES